jgi:hypothetical protein
MVWWTPSSPVTRLFLGTSRELDRNRTEAADRAQLRPDQTPAAAAAVVASLLVVVSLIRVRKLAAVDIILSESVVWFRNVR